MEEKKETKMSLGTFTIILVIVALIIVGGVYYFLVVNKKDTGNTDANNITNNVAEQNTIEQTTIIEEKLSMTQEQFPKVDGATAMLPMIGEMTKAVMGFTDEQAQKFLDENTNGKTAKVYAGLIDKKTDVIFASEPSDDILKQAKEANVEFEMTGIGLDGFVFLLNEQNPVKSLTIEQIQDIYTGKITNWKEVGGDDAKIIAYQREANSGSQNLMEKMVMKGKKMQDPQGDTVLSIDSMEGLVDSISNTNSKYSIGYSIYLYAKEQYIRDNIKFLEINGVEATDNAIANGSYPLTKIVYAIMRKDEPEDSNARKLVKWLQTTEGQKVVQAGGYVKLQQK